LKTSSSRASPLDPHPQIPQAPCLDYWDWVHSVQKGFEVVAEVSQVGAGFVELDVLVFIAPSVSPCIFLHPKNDLRNDVLNYVPKRSHNFFEN